MFGYSDGGSDRKTVIEPILYNPTLPADTTSGAAYIPLNQSSATNDSVQQEVVAIPPPPPAVPSWTNSTSTYQTPYGFPGDEKRRGSDVGSDHGSVASGLSVAEYLQQLKERSAAVASSSDAIPPPSYESETQSQTSIAKPPSTTPTTYPKDEKQNLGDEIITKNEPTTTTKPQPEKEKEKEKEKDSSSSSSSQQQPLPTSSSRRSHHRSASHRSTASTAVSTNDGLVPTGSDLIDFDKELQLTKGLFKEWDLEGVLEWGNFVLGDSAIEVLNANKITGAKLNEIVNDPEILRRDLHIDSLRIRAEILKALGNLRKAELEIVNT
ncbi:hypothetical protein HDU76_007347 [Blyttiomyces sp. JEL0837]|nr:hypothetical protein HDU76_007347 [Blyttiomyces sp. JEL0837]